MLRELHLSGRMRKQFGPVLRFDAKSPAEMLRAACTIVPGFENALREGEWHLKRGHKGPEGLDLQELSMHIGLGRTKDVYLIPATQASKKGLGKVLLGAVMIGAAFATGGVSIGATAAVSGTTMVGTTAVSTAVISTSLSFVGAMGFVAKMGLMMALGGLSSMLTPKPKFNRAEAAKNESFMFSGASNTAVQGDAVPLVYGRVMAGSVVVSAGMDVEQIQTGSSGVATNDYNPLTGSWDYGFGNVAAKGGKGGGGSTASEAPNNLQSNATISLVELISEGPCYGLADQTDILKSIYLDDVVVRNSDDTDNFQGLIVEERFGEATQTAMPGFSNVESENAVGVDVTDDTPVVRSISDTNIDDVRVTITVPALYTVNTDTGAISEASVQFTVEIQPDGGSYTEVLDYTISGKTNSGYQIAFRLPLEGTGPWNVRVSRVTPDSEVSSLQNDISWTSYTEIVNQRLYYPNRAVIGLKADSKQFGSRIPNRTYDYKGRIIKVPSNYDAETRAYTGIWDGTFTTAWTDNPAWILYDILTNTRYGLGDDIPEEYVNKWVLYEIGAYCDELVPDGSGGMEPRYTINTQIKDRGEAWELLSNIVSTFRGMFYWGSGTLEFTYDHDETPTKLVSRSNVIGGKFNYSSGQFRSQHSVVVVAWNDPEIMHRVNYEVVEDPELIAKYGYKTLETTAWGSTSRGQANRVGRWILDTEKHGEFLQYKASIDHADVRPGSIIEVNDEEYNSTRMAGRLASGSTTTVLNLDSPLTKGAGGTVRVVLEDGSVEERTVSTGAGTTSTLTVTSAFSSAPAAEALWSYAASGTEHRLFRVMAVEESGTLEYAITATYHDPNKFDRVEANLDLPPNDFVTLPTGPLLPPTSLAIKEFLYREGHTVEPAMIFSWSAPDDPRVTFYEYQVKLSADSDWGDTYRTTRLSGVVRPVSAGDWDLRVRSCNDLGVKGIWVISEEVAVTASADPPDAVTGLTKVTNAEATTSVLRWDLQPSTEVRPLEYEIYYHASSVTFGDAASLGRTSNVEWLLTRAGNYWVVPVSSTVYGTETMIAVLSSDLNDFSNFNSRNDRIATAVTAPTVSGTGSAIDHVLNKDGSADVSFEWVWGGTEYDIDGFQVAIISRTSASAYTIGTDATIEEVHVVPANKRALILNGLNPNTYYTFYVRAYRRVDSDIDASGYMYSTWVKSTASGENPYRPSSNPVFEGDITGTINSVAAATVSTAITNFNNRNDRDATAVTSPTIPGSGTAIDHTLNNGGLSADISFEWLWAGAEADIDGFEIAWIGQSGSGAYTIGGSAASETHLFVPSASRSFIVYGVDPTLYYTFYVRAYRVVDYDISSAEVLYSSWVKSSVAGENPYQPATSIAFSGNVSGTVNSVAVATVTAGITNFNNRNDRDNTALTAPATPGSGTCIDHVLNSGGLSCDLSFEWTWGGTEADIDGFQILYIGQTGSGAYTVGGTPAAETSVVVPSGRRAFILYGADPTLYYTFYVRAFRVVDPDVDANEVLYSSWVKSTYAGENPYRPASSVAYTGDITGTIDGVDAGDVSSVVSTIDAYGASNIVSAATNFNDRNDRIATAVVAPTTPGSGTCIDHVMNAGDLSCDLSFEWVWGGAEADIDGFEVLWVGQSSASAYTVGGTPAIESSFNIPADRRAVIFYGLDPTLYYTFYVRAYRVVDPDVNAAEKMVSAWVKSTYSGENPYRPASSIAFTGDVTGTIDGTNASTVGSVATTIDTYGASNVVTAVTNFNDRNDRIATAVTAATIAGDGTAIDHTLNNGGLTADISFEWSWGGTEADIDGFEVVYVGRTSASAYTIGGTPAIETSVFVPANRRAMFFYGVDPTLYYTFYIRAYRVVDPDVDADEVMYSSWVKSAASGENPYRPASSTAYSGDVTGTINGTSASTVAGVATNFNARNDRLAAAVTVPTILSDGSAVDHAANTGGLGVDISFEWGWSGTEADIDGFELMWVGRSSASAYTAGSTPAIESVIRVPADRRAHFLYAVDPVLYYTFYVRAYRIVDPDVNAAGFLASSWVKPSLAAENPYRPASSITFTGDVTGTINGTNASTVATAATNFNSRNDRIATAVVAPTVTGGGSAVDHTINTDGSSDISFEWVWSGTESEIDGFEIAIVARTSSSTHTVSGVNSIETRYFVPPNVRSYFLNGVATNLYYTFAVRAYRIVDNDIDSSNIKTSTWAQPSSGDSENPYRPSANVAFTGDISGTTGYAPYTQSNGLVIYAYRNWAASLISGQDLKYTLKRYKGNTDVSSSATWTATSSHLTMSVSNGVVTIDNLGSWNGYGVVKSAYEGIDQEVVVMVEQQVSPPPAADDENISVGEPWGAEGVTSSTYAAASGVMAVKTGASGAAEVKTYFAAYAEASGTFEPKAKMQRRSIGGSWTDVAENTSITSTTYDARAPVGVLGSVTVTDTGLSANTWYEYQILVAKDGGTTTGRFRSIQFAARGY